MHTDVETQNTNRGEDLRPHLLVGVDERHRSVGALEWAASEAVRRHLAVRLTTICRVLPGAEFSVGPEVEDSTRGYLQEAADRLAGGVDVMPVSVTTGSPVTGLLAGSTGAELLVVGHRDLGTLHRSTLGSTSIAVAGRSPVTVVVVPDGWSPEDRPAAPVVLGLRLPEADDEPDDEPGHPASIALAFDRAQALQVPLVVVHAWEAPAILAWSPPSDLAAAGEQVRARVERLVTPWRERYAGVDVRIRTVAGRPADVLHEASSDGRLVVLGRRTAPDHHGGLRFGSTVRAFLHHAETPVAVVPAEDVQRS